MAFTLPGFRKINHKAHKGCTKHAKGKFFVSSVLSLYLRGYPFLNHKANEGYTKYLKEIIKNNP
jgi:hypothetical protein